MKIINRLLSVIFYTIILNINCLAQLNNSNIRITHGPWLQNPDENGITVMWATNKECVPWIMYGEDKSLTIKAQNSMHGLFEACDTIHKVMITGLKPGTTYYYKIFSQEILKFKPYQVYYGDEVKSRTLSFTTLDREKESFFFSVISDVHGKAARLDEMLNQINMDITDLIFLNGDIISYIDHDGDLYNEFLDTCVNNFAKEIPLIINRGNHETRGYKARNYYRYLDTPDDKFYYSFNHGPVHFIMMDSGEDKPDSSQY